MPELAIGYSDASVIGVDVRAISCLRDAEHLDAVTMHWVAFGAIFIVGVDIYVAKFALAHLRSHRDRFDGSEQIAYTSDIFM